MESKSVPVCVDGNDTEWVLIVFADVVLATEMNEVLLFALIIIPCPAALVEFITPINDVRLLPLIITPVPCAPDAGPQLDV